jgi:hypothetical protein
MKKLDKTRTKPDKTGQTRKKRYHWVVIHYGTMRNFKFILALWCVRWWGAFGLEKIEKKPVTHLTLLGMLRAYNPLGKKSICFFQDEFLIVFK